MMSSLFLDALNGDNFDGRPPVWLMRQAGRYMPAYRKIREKYSFLQMCREPEVVEQITHLPIDLLGVDAAILFADILLLADAMGTELSFVEGKGPVFNKPLVDAQSIDALHMPQVRTELGYVGKACARLKESLSVPLIGFAGAPFTVASYMIEGGSSRDLKKTRQWLVRDPKSFHRLMEKLTSLTIEYLKMQIENGVCAVQLFDTWAIHLSWEEFHDVSLRYMRQICEALAPFPTILFCKGSSLFAEPLASTGAAVSLDSQCDLATVGRKIRVVQGNLDPFVLYGSREKIQQEVHRCLEAMSSHPGYIFNLGHGLLPDMEQDKVRWLVECVQEANVCKP